MIRTILAAGLGLALLAGCNLNRENDGVRGGPQAVHPSPSALAQGTTAPVAAPAAAPSTYTPVAGDGSQPIID